MSIESWGVTLAWASELPGEKVCLRDWGSIICMVPCHNCNVYGIWTIKEMREGGGFKVIVWGASHKGGGNFYEGVLTPLGTMDLFCFYCNYNTFLNLTL